MKTFLLLAGLVLPLAAQAQLSELSRDTHSSNLNNGYALVPPEAVNVQGSAFLLSGWVPGKLQLRGSGTALATPLKYDIYHMELRAKRPAGDSVVVPLIKVQGFSLESDGAPRRFVCYSAASLPTDINGGCGEVLYEDSAVQLLKFQRKELVKRTADNSAYFSNYIVSTLEEQAPRYYLHWPTDGHFSAVKLKRASLEQALAGQPAALAALKARKGSVGSEAELAAAVLAVAPLLTGASK